MKGTYPGSASGKGREGGKRIYRERGESDLKVQDDVHNVLQDTWPRYFSRLGHMTYKKHRDVLALCNLHKGCCTLPDLQRRSKGMGRHNDDDEEEEEVVDAHDDGDDDDDMMMMMMMMMATTAVMMMMMMMTTTAAAVMMMTRMRMRMMMMTTTMMMTTPMLMMMIMNLSARPQSPRTLPSSFCHLVSSPTLSQNGLYVPCSSSPSPFLCLRIAQGRQKD